MTIRSFKFNRQSTEAFLDFREALYSRDVGWMPLPRCITLAQFLPDFDFHQRSSNDHRCFLAIADGKVVGHVTASFCPERVDRGGRAAGALGHFECIEDYGVAADLLGAASTWLQREYGVAHIWAPLNFDIWHGYRCKTAGFEEEPFLGEPQNKPYYSLFFDRFGFAALHNWTTVEVSGRAELETIAAASAHRYETLSKSGYRFQSLDLASDAGRRRLHAAEMAAFRGFVGYTPCAYPEFDALFRAYLSVTSGRFTFVASDPVGNDAGFSLAYPDAGDCTRAHQGDFAPGARAASLWHGASRPKRAVFYMIGASSPRSIGRRGLAWDRRHGLGRAMFHFTLRSLLTAGFDHIVFALITKETQGYAILGDAMQHQRRSYALFELKT